VQDPRALWTFDGTFPVKLLQARYGEGILFRHFNALPVDPAANMGFGCHTITTYLHNGHNPAESDGYMHAWFFPGQFHDFRWPVILAGTTRSMWERPTRTPGDRTATGASRACAVTGARP